MPWHIIEGEAGCRFARENGCVAVIVDALRASATAATLLERGARRVLAVDSVEAALATQPEQPGALLFGERGGLPPAGFDFGNSPRDAPAARNRDVIFTTTTGTGRLLECAGCPEVYMASTVNALAACTVFKEHSEDIVLIPAGKMGDLGFAADEDWAAAAYIAVLADGEVGEGALETRDWQRRIEWDGLAKLFADSEHGQRLTELGLGEDVVWCAQVNCIAAVPKVTEWRERSAILEIA